MKYCQRCGRQIEDTAKSCPFCLVTQEENPAETKKCKKCGKKIPVNANYCPFCGADQAFFYYDDQTGFKPKSAHKAPVKETPKAKQADESSESDSEGMAKNTTEVLPRNESPVPGLVVSTKLLIKDTFRISKRMGRADYWWAFLGLNLLSLVAGLLMGVILTLIESFAPQLLWQTFRLLLSFWLTFVYISITTAQIRRLHDCGWSAWLILFKFVFAIGDVFILFAMIQPQSTQNLRYTFKEKK